MIKVWDLDIVNILKPKKSNYKNYILLQLPLKHSFRHQKITYLTWSHYKHHNTLKVLLNIAPSSDIVSISLTWKGFQPLTIFTKRSILDVAAALDPPLLWLHLQNEDWVECYLQKSQKQIKLQNHGYLLSKSFDVPEVLDLLRMKPLLTCWVIYLS